MALTYERDNSLSVLALLLGIVTKVAVEFSLAGRPCVTLSIQ